jgi:transposase, IS30 family
MYQHLSREERISLATLLREGYTQKAVADALGVHPSTVCRELRRNSDGRYHATHAETLARNRRTRSKQKYRLLEQHTQIAHTVEALLCPLISPKVIGHCLGIHHQTIYRWIERSRPDLRTELPYRGRKRRRYGGKREEKQGWTRLVRSIDIRPNTTGLSWEGDTMKGGCRERVLTHVEQTSLYLRADLMPDGTADSVHRILTEHPLTGSITYDRGSEFALWNMIERDTAVTIFFAHAHHPWERGKNENTNGRLRRVFPKRFDFSTITVQDLSAVVDLMNHTPRESLDWQTPAEVFQKVSCTSG